MALLRFPCGGHLGCNSSWKRQSFAEESLSKRRVRKILLLAANVEVHWCSLFAVATACAKVDMFIALKDEAHADILALWRVARSVNLSVRLIDKDMDKGALLKASLLCSGEANYYTENSFLLWSLKLADFLKVSLPMPKTSRSLKKDLRWLEDNEPGLRYRGQAINRAMLHASQCVVSVFHEDPGSAAAADALLRLSLRHGPDVLSLHYTKMVQVASCVRRWSLDRLSIGETAAYIIDLMHLELNDGIRSADFFRRAQLELPACSACEKLGHCCSQKCKSSPCWLRTALEKCRLHCWLIGCTKEGSREDQQLAAAFEKLLQSPLATSSLSDEEKKSLQPWLDVLEGCWDQAFKKNNVAELREQLRTDLGFLKKDAGSPSSPMTETKKAAEDSPARREKARMLEKASAYLEEHIVFCVPSSAAKEEDYEKAWASIANHPALVPGILNKQHRLFVLSTELLFDPQTKQPWSLSSDLGLATRQLNILKAALGWACKQASGAGDMILVSHFQNMKVRALVEECLRTSSHAGHTGTVRCFWSCLPRPGRRVFASDTAECWSALLYCKSPRVRITAVQREEP